VLNVKLQLFALIAKQPTFHQLRTVEQLGYITVLMQRCVKPVPPNYHTLHVISALLFYNLQFFNNIGMILVSVECSLSSNPQ
jgi:hypothetical protein